MDSETGNTPRSARRFENAERRASSCWFIGRAATTIAAAGVIAVALSTLLPLLVLAAGFERAPRCISTSSGTAAEPIRLAIPHVVLINRIRLARMPAAGQRAEDLRRFTDVKQRRQPPAKIQRVGPTNSTGARSLTLPESIHAAFHVVVRWTSAVQKLLSRNAETIMMSLVRLLGFTKLACGCVTGRYREVATNREVTYVEEKGAGCDHSSHRRNHTLAPARFGVSVLTAKAS